MKVLAVLIALAATGAGVAYYVTRSNEQQAGTCQVKAKAACCQVAATQEPEVVTAPSCCSVGGSRTELISAKNAESIEKIDIEPRVID